MIALYQLKYLQWRGRFPRGRYEIPDDAIAHVARQIGASAGDMGFYDVTNRQASSHRAEIRRHTAVRSGGRDMISRDHGTIPA